MIGYFIGPFAIYINIENIKRVCNTSILFPLLLSSYISRYTFVINESTLLHYY